MGLPSPASDQQQVSPAVVAPTTGVQDRVCAVIVTYNPPPALYDNVCALSGQVDGILVIDNASGPECRPVLERLRELPGTEIIQNATNTGIGAALNVGVHRAAEQGYPWAATFDQDSRAGPGFIAEMLRAYHAHAARERIGLVVPRYCEEKLGLVHDRLGDDAPESAIVTTSMMSGNLVRTAVIAEVGFYDERFFIDYVDHEFCLRLRRRGFQVLESHRSLLQHNLGRITQTTIAGLAFTTTNHSALRRYYNARNRTLVYRWYGRSVPGWVMRDLKSFVVETGKILLLEQDRRAKLINVARGVWHGLISTSPPPGRHSGTAGPTP